MDLSTIKLVSTKPPELQSQVLVRLVVVGLRGSRNLVAMSKTPLGSVGFWGRSKRDPRHSARYPCGAISRLACRATSPLSASKGIHCPPSTSRCTRTKQTASNCGHKQMFTTRGICYSRVLVSVSILVSEYAWSSSSRWSGLLAWESLDGVLFYPKLMMMHFFYNYLLSPGVSALQSQNYNSPLEIVWFQK
jgi:hypothetical protein